MSQMSIAMSSGARSERVDESARIRQIYRDIFQIYGRLEQDGSIEMDFVSRPLFQVVNRFL